MYRNPDLKAARSTEARMRRARAFDAQYQAAVRGRAFDAFGSSGLAFLQSQLEMIDPDIVEPLQENTAPRDIPMKVGGGFIDYVSVFGSNYASPGTKNLGFQGTSNTEIPVVQADVQKANWPTFNWAAAMFISFIDLKKMEEAHRNGMPAPISLQELYEESCATLWNKAKEYNAYFGNFGHYGLINQTTSPETAVNDGAGGHKAWSTKTPAEILADVNYLITLVLQNSVYATGQAMPNRMLVPWTQYALLTAPMTLAGVGQFASIREYIEKQCLAALQGADFKILPLANDWISGQGAGSPATDRCVVYRNDEKSLLIRETQPIMKGFTMPTSDHGGGYETVWYACITPLMIKRAQTMIYGDGI